MISVIIFIVSLKIHNRIDYEIMKFPKFASRILLKYVPYTKHIVRFNLEHFIFGTSSIIFIILSADFID